MIALQINHKLTHEQLEYWFEHMGQMDIRKREQRQRLVDTFINAIFLYDDKLVITFNYQNGTKTISKEDWLRSDLSGHLRPLNLVNTNKKTALIG